MDYALFRGVVMGSLTLFGVVLASVITEWVQTGWVARSTLLEVSLVLMGLLVLLGYTLHGRPRPRPERCICGKQRFETIRSDNRRHVLTCFACGRETTLQAPETGPVPRRPSGV